MSQKHVFGTNVCVRAPTTIIQIVITTGILWHSFVVLGMSACSTSQPINSGSFGVVVMQEPLCVKRVLLTSLDSFVLIYAVRFETSVQHCA